MFLIHRPLIIFENDSYCMHNFNETEKDRVVKDRIVRNSKL